MGEAETAAAVRQIAAEGESSTDRQSIGQSVPTEDGPSIRSIDSQRQVQRETQKIEAVAEGEAETQETEPAACEEAAPRVGGVAHPSAFTVEEMDGYLPESESPQTETPQPTPQYFPTNSPATGDVPPTEATQQLSTPVNQAMLDTCMAGLTQSNQTNHQSLETLTSSIERITTTLCTTLTNGVAPINTEITKNQEVIREVAHEMIRRSQAETPPSAVRRESAPSPVPFAIPASPSPTPTPEIVGAMALNGL